MEAGRWKPLTIITKSSILDVTAVLDPPLYMYEFHDDFRCKRFIQCKTYTSKCAPPRVVIVIMTSQLSKVKEWFKICDALRDLVPFVQF